jgi:hypothetical protein
MNEKCVELRYVRGDTVKILPLDGTTGRVEGAYIGLGVRYDVRYFNNGAAANCYFGEDELDASNGSGNNATARPSVTIAEQLNGVPLLPMLAADRSTVFAAANYLDLD